ncbi:MAG: M14 family zinc carboxypeptidase [Solirubrobacterales bacterium]
MAYPSSPDAIEKRIRALDPPTGKKYAAYCTRFDLPHRTHEGTTGGSPGRVVSCLRIGTGTGEGRPRILIVGGIHAREWVPPDAIVTFVEKLLEAYRTSKPIAYERFVDKRKKPSIPYAEARIPFEPDVKLMIERAELYIVPLANPDGRAFSMSAETRKGWRKNRRPAPTGVTCPALPKPNVWASNDPAGVDLNRNFDIAWDFNTYYGAAAAKKMAETGELGISDSPCSPSQTFHGPSPSPASAPREIEPETLNIQELIDSKKINFFVDVHSAAGKILFPWGLEQNQETDPTQTFHNPAFDRGNPTERDGPGPAYKEWMPPGSEKSHRMLGEHMAARIADSTGFTANQALKDKVAETARNESNYDTVPATDLFGTSLEFTTGASEEFAFSRSIGKEPGTPVKAKALDPIFAFTFECCRASDGGFQPNATTEYPKVEREVAVGLAALIAFVATWKAPVPPPATTTPPAPPPATPAKSPSCCFIATAAYGSPHHPKVRYLCDIRDDELKTTEFGRRFMYGVERVYYTFSPQTAEWLHRHERARRAVRHGIVEPWIAIVWTAETLTHRVRPAELRAGAFLGLVSVATLAAIVAIALLPFALAHSLTSLA